MNKFSPEFQKEVQHLLMLEKRKEEALRYITYFDNILTRVHESSLIEQVQIYELLEYIDKNRLWDPQKWEELHPKWRWELERKIWEWYMELVPIKNRDIQQKRIILSK